MVFGISKRSQKESSGGGIVSLRGRRRKFSGHRSREIWSAKVMYNVRSDRDFAWMKADHILNEAAEAYGCEQSFFANI